MSIKPLLFLAGLLAIGACATGTGPNPICALDQDTQWTTCASEANPLPTVLPVPYDEPSAGSIE
jgi:hypothetical protein